MRQVMFSHEKFVAYQRAIAFVAWSNIAEGNGKFAEKERARFWQIAHGSAVECAAILDAPWDDRERGRG